VTRALTTAVLQSRLETVTKRVRWFDQHGAPIASTTPAELAEDDGSAIKEAIVKWLETKKK